MENKWIYEGKEVKNIEDMPKGCCGFIYNIINKTKDKFYIGRKQLINNYKLPPLKGKGKRKRKIKKETWLQYTGSNLELNNDIKNGDIIEKNILIYCYSKKQMTYYEVKYQYIMGCLEVENCYNQQIMGKIWRKDII